MGWIWRCKRLARPRRLYKPLVSVFRDACPPHREMSDAETRINSPVEMESRWATEKQTAERAVTRRASAEGETNSHRIPLDVREFIARPSDRSSNQWLSRASTENFGIYRQRVLARWIKLLACCFHLVRRLLPVYRGINEIRLSLRFLRFYFRAGINAVVTIKVWL